MELLHFLGICPEPTDFRQALFLEHALDPEIKIQNY